MAIRAILASEVRRIRSSGFKLVLRHQSVWAARYDRGKCLRCMLASVYHLDRVQHLGSSFDVLRRVNMDVAYFLRQRMAFISNYFVSR